MMRIHSIEITNVAGTRYQRVELADITIIRGDNEVGKTTLMNAADILLTFPDSSNHTRVKAIIPSDTGAMPEIRVDMTIGEHRFTYYKRYSTRSGANKTELTFAEPASMQGKPLHSRDAHDKVQELLAAGADTGLWKALWIEQTGQAALPALEGRSGLLEAVDAAAGEAADETDDVEDSRDEADGEDGERRNTTIVQAVRKEYLNYFTTKNGEHNKDFKIAAQDATTAETGLAAAQAVVAEADRWISEHASTRKKIERIDADLAEQQPREQELTARCAELDNAAEGIAALEREAHGARREADDAKQLAEARRALAAQASQHAGTEAETADLSEAAAAEAQDAREAAEGAESVAGCLAETMAASARQAAQARADFDRIRDVEELVVLTRKLARIGEATGELERLHASIAALPDIDERAVAAIEAAATEEIGARARLQAAAARLRVDAIADVAVRDAAGNDDTIPAGEHREWTLAGGMSFTVPGTLSLSVTAGAGEKDLRRDAEDTGAKLARLCQAAGVAGLADARSQLQRRTELQTAAGTARGIIDAELGGVPEPDLRAAAAQLEAKTTAGRPDDASPLPGSRQEAEHALTAAAEQADSDRGRWESADAAARRLDKIAGEARAAALVAAGAAKTAAESARASAEQLELARGKQSDADLTGRAEGLLGTAKDAEDQWRDALEAYSGENAEQARAELGRVRAAMDSAAGQRRQLEDHLVELDTQLRTVAGAHEAQAGAEVIRDRKVGEFEAMKARAEAARVLYEALTAHRRAARAAYVAPYQARLEALASTAFDRPVTVALDDNLAVVSRTMDGASVDYPGLSGGAKEQLAVCARLAFASLVAKGDGLVPVIIDDALGYTDDDRMENIDRVFNAAKSRCQVIILTCTRNRYAGVNDAATIELNRRTAPPTA